MFHRVSISEPQQRIDSGDHRGDGGVHRLERSRRFLLGCVGAALTAAAGSALADFPSRLVVGSYAFNDPMLVSMNLDGTDAIEIFEPAASGWLLIGLEFDLHGFYWTHGSTPGTVRTAAADGSDEAVVVGGLRLPRGLSLDRSADQLYWAASPASGSASGLIQRVNTDGTGLEDFFTLTPYDPDFSFVGSPTVDATNGYVYFCADGKILRKRTDGTGSVETVVRGVTTVRGISLDIAQGHVYFLDANTNSDYLGRCGLDDTGFEVIVDMSPGINVSSGLWDLEVDLADGRAYWADEIAAVVRRARLDGTEVETIHASPAGQSPTSLTFDVAAVQPIQDCNGNSVPDRDDIDGGASADCNGNGVPDECEDDPCAVPDYVLDHGSDTIASGRTVSGDPGSTGFEVFQPFDLTTETTLAGLELDGWTVNYQADGFVATLFPDDGTGEFADESSPIAAADFQWRFSGTSAVWVSQDLSATLPAGRWWIRLTANDPDYDAVAHHGLTGLPSRSRRNSDGQIFVSSRSIALRLIGGDVSAVDASMPGSVTGSVGRVDLAVFPNPAHGAVEIALSAELGLAPGSPARLEIHDVGGRIVRTLTASAPRAGAAPVRVAWDGRDDAGRAVASGRYYCLVDSEQRPGRAVIVLLP